MKAITLHQPYATLAAIGAKQYETRGFSTKHRGPIAIHAGKSHQTMNAITLELWRYKDLPYLKPFCKHLVETIQEYTGKPYDEFIWPYGQIIAIADVVDCRPAYDLAKELPERVIAFGDYGIGRYAWKLENVKLINPVRVTGKQGLWNWEGGE